MKIKSLLTGAVLLACAPTLLLAEEHVFREHIEGVYYNDWFASERPNADISSSMVDVEIRGEGKTVDYEGAFLADCRGAEILEWYYSTNFGSDADPYDTIPDAALDAAYRSLC